MTINNNYVWVAIIIILGNQLTKCIVIIQVSVRVHTG